MPPATFPLTKVLLLGLAAGFLSGMFGIGGGTLIVPVLVLLLGMDQRFAHGTSLAAVLPIAVSGVIGFALEDSVDWPATAGLVAGAMAGAVIGTHALHVLSTKALGYSFAFVLLASAVRLLVDDADAAGRGDVDLAMVVGFVLVGLLAGTLAGLLGVGGGVVMVPAMVILFGIPSAVAKGTSLAVIIPTSIVGTHRNVRRGNCDLKVAAIVGIAGVVSAYLASKISVGLDEAVSNGLFAALLAVVAVRMFVSTRKEAAAGAAEPAAA